MTENLNKKIINATKWSAMTELLSKLIVPFTSMVMARLLTPEAFGIVATFSVIITISDIFSDAGFQWYLIQHEFSDEIERDQCTNVAFWSNFSLSFFIWGIIGLFNKQLAELVGSKGLGHVLIIACSGIPLNGFCSIQMALFKRDFDFKTLFLRRVVSIIVPLFVNIPLAYIYRNYWALIIGTLVGNLSNAILLSIKSNWKPRLYFSWNVLLSMAPFCLWRLLASILVWISGYADIFFIGKMLNTYYLGIYRISITLVGQIVALITAIILPIIMPSLSRLQNDTQEMKKMLLKFQKMTGIILIPLGIGIYVFRRIVTGVILGNQWVDAEELVGIWGLMESVTVIFNRFCTPVYSAIGKPKISVIVQLLHLCALIPTIVISGHFGFRALYISRALMRIQMVIINIIAVYILINQSPIRMIINIMPETCCAIIMGVLGIILLIINNGIIISFVWILVCILIYFLLLNIFPNERKILKSLFQMSMIVDKKI